MIVKLSEIQTVNHHVNENLGRIEEPVSCVSSTVKTMKSERYDITKITCCVNLIMRQILLTSHLLINISHYL